MPKRSRTLSRAQSTAKARAARYRSLQNDLDEAQLGLERGLDKARNDESLQSAVGGDFLRELVRICRADSRLLAHPVARRVMAAPRRPDRLKLLLWLKTAVKLRALLLTLERGVVGEEITVRPEDTLRAAGISNKRQAKYQRRRS